MANTRKPEELEVHRVNACIRENTPRQHIEIQCPNCKQWQTILLAEDSVSPLRENEFRVLRDATLWPMFVCRQVAYLKHRKVEMCPWAGRVQLVTR